MCINVTCKGQAGSFYLHRLGTQSLMLEPLFSSANQFTDSVFFWLQSGCRTGLLWCCGNAQSIYFEAVFSLMRSSDTEDYILFTPKLMVRWELRARRTNQPPPFHRLTMLSACGYGWDDHVVNDRHMTISVIMVNDRCMSCSKSTWAPPHCQLRGHWSVTWKFEYPRVEDLQILGDFEGLCA